MDSAVQYTGVVWGHHREQLHVCVCVCVQVYMHKGRLLLSLQAVKHALKLAGPAHPDVHRLVVRLCKAVQQRHLHSGVDPVHTPPPPPKHPTPPPPSLLDNPLASSTQVPISPLLPVTSSSPVLYNALQSQPITLGCALSSSVGDIQFAMLIT